MRCVQAARTFPKTNHVLLDFLLVEKLATGCNNISKPLQKNRT